MKDKELTDVLFAKPGMVEGLDHFHLAVRSLDQAANFFSRFLGVEASAVYENPEAQFRFCFFRAGSAVLQLMEPTSSQSPIAQFIEHKGQGIHAVSFKVNNLDTAINELQGLGVRPMGKHDAGIIKQAYFHPADTFGIMMELCQYQGKLGSMIELFEKAQGH